MKKLNIAITFIFLIITVHVSISQNYHYEYISKDMADGDTVFVLSRNGAIKLLKKLNYCKEKLKEDSVELAKVHLTADECALQLKQKDSIIIEKDNELERYKKAYDALYTEYNQIKKKYKIKDK